MTIPVTGDLKDVHKFYKKLKNGYSQNRESSFFMAICLYLDPDPDLDIAMKVKPCDELIVIDNSTLDKYFKSYNLLMLRAYFATPEVLSLNKLKKGRIIRMIYPDQ